MAGIRVIQLQEAKPAPPLHRPWIKNWRVGYIVVLIDATLARTQRVSSNSATPPVPISAAAPLSRIAAFSSADGVKALRLTVHAPIDSRRCDHALELLALFFLRRTPLERWKGSWLIGTTWIGNDVTDLLAANNNASRSDHRVILVTVSSDASGG